MSSRGRCFSLNYAIDFTINFSFPSPTLQSSPTWSILFESWNSLDTIRGRLKFSSSNWAIRSALLFTTLQKWCINETHLEMLICTIELAVAGQLKWITFCWSVRMSDRVLFAVISWHWLLNCCKLWRVSRSTFYDRTVSSWDIRKIVLWLILKARTRRFFALVLGWIRTY